MDPRQLKFQRSSRHSFLVFRVALCFVRALIDFTSGYVTKSAFINDERRVLSLVR